jgi:hypothetical protein
MLIWGNELLSNIIRGGLSMCFTAHPDISIPEHRWGLITSRITPVILSEHRKRFGAPVDRVVAEYVAKEVMKIVEQSFRDAA